MTDDARLDAALRRLAEIHAGAAPGLGFDRRVMESVRREAAPGAFDGAGGGDPAALAARLLEAFRRRPALFAAIRAKDREAFLRLAAEEGLPADASLLRAAAGALRAEALRAPSPAAAELSDEVLEKVAGGAGASADLGALEAALRALLDLGKR